MADKPFSSCCGIYWVKYKQAVQDLQRFAGRAGRPPYSEAQKARVEKLKADRVRAKQDLADHQADTSLEHGYLGGTGPK